AMERSLEQRYAIKFCVRLGKNVTETFQMLQEAFKDDCISRSQSGRWHKAFKEGREEVADEPRSGRPTTARTDENVNRVCEVLRSDRRLSIQYIADTLNMSTFASDIKDAIKLHHDNAPSHMAFIVANYLARSNTPVVPQPPYSPDLAPCDFFLFPRLKRELKGKHWESVENIQKHVTTFLRDIPVEEFQHAFQTRLRKCIDSGGEYFEEF
ncbi:MOS1T transposase, partial [Acromyrmex insinuator]